ncbi:Imm50 family immunity protein [Pseudomonas fitomaticsae]
MKHWNDIAESTFFNMIFSSPIAIGEIKLFILNIDNNYSTVTLGFDIPEIPDTPPKKWETMGFNACRIGITCSEIEDLALHNLPTNKNLRLTIKNTGSRFRVSAISDDSSIHFTTAFISLREPTVYLSSIPFHET